MINFNKKDLVADAVKNILEKQETAKMDIKYDDTEAEETPARKSIKATGCIV